MSTALDFTVDIGSLPTRDQGPLKAKKGMFVQTPERVKSDQMLAEAPPVSLESRFENQMPQTIEPLRASDGMFVSRPQMDPQLQQILQAQNDMTGIMSAPLSGIPLLMARETFDI